MSFEDTLLTGFFPIFLPEQGCETFSMISEVCADFSKEASEAFANFSKEWTKARASLHGRINQACKHSAIPLSETCDISSIARNSWSAALSISGQSGGLAFNVFGIIGAVFIIFNALRLIYKAASKATEAKTTEMRVLHTFVHLPANIAYLVVGLGMLVLKVSEIAGKAGIAAVSGLTLMWSFLAMSVIMFGEAIYSLHTTYKLQDILEDKGDSALTIDMLKALALKDEALFKKLTKLEDSDVYYANELIQNADLHLCSDSDAETNRILQEVKLRAGENWDQLLKIAKIAKLKSLATDYLEKLGLQTNEDCAKKIQDFNLWSEINKLQGLLEEVEHANYDANTDAWMLLAITGVSIIAAGTGLAFTGPVGVTAEALVTIVASLGWMNFDSSKLRKEIKDYFWEHHQNCKKADNEYGLQEKTIFAVKTAALILTAPLWVIPAFVYHDIVPVVRNKISILPKESEETFGSNMSGAI